MRIAPGVWQSPRQLSHRGRNRVHHRRLLQSHRPRSARFELALPLVPLRPSGGRRAGLGFGAFPRAGEFSNRANAFTYGGEELMGAEIMMIL